MFFDLLVVVAKVWNLVEAVRGFSAYLSEGIEEVSERGAISDGVVEAQPLNRILASSVT